MSNAQSPQECSTVIGADAKFKGDLTFQGGVRVDGEFEGSITTPGKVLVSESGKMKAQIQAGSSSIDGQVEGNIVAEDRIELNATARLQGDVKAAKLLVREGATFVGRCEVGGSMPKADKPAQSAQSAQSGQSGQSGQQSANAKAIADAARGRK